MKSWFTLLIIGGILLLTTACTQPKELRQATWLWDATLLHDPNDIVSFLTKHNFNTIFIQIDTSISTKTYATFIQAAAEHDIAVYALDGAPTWATNEQQANVFFDWLDAYMHTYNETPFTGIHVDVEPYLHPDWQTNEAFVVEQFQHFLTKAKQRAQQLSLPLEADLPFWFDEVTYDNTYGEGNVAQWTIELLDGVTLMAYRDDATTIINITEQEMAFANAANKPLTIGVETMKSDEGSFISFYGRDVEYLNEQLAHIEKHYNQDALHGIALHHYETIKTLID